MSSVCHNGKSANPFLYLISRMEEVLLALNDLENTIIVTGHTPTFLIREDRLPLIYQGNGHLAIDCGCVYGERLSAYCLDTGKAEYVEREKK